ncbi:MAG: hypothetical protein AAF557_03505 [Pseudomonadota bacterium]
MFGRVMTALIRSPGYGILVALATLPVTLVGNLVLGMFGVMAILLPLLILIFAFLVQVAIFVQTARFAGNFSGLKRFPQQPDFFVAAGKGLMVCFLGQILLGLIVTAVTLFFLEFRGGEALWWLNPDKLFKAVERVMKQPDLAAYVFTFEGFDLDGLIMVLRAVYMVFMTMLAIFIVPLACGESWGSERTYTVGLIVVRFLIAMPLLAGIAGLLSHFGVLGANFAIAAIWPDASVPLFVRFGLELALFAGMIFSFEALLLKTGIEQEHDEAAARQAYLASGGDDLRALRQSRMDH